MTDRGDGSLIFRIQGRKIKEKQKKKIEADLNLIRRGDGPFTSQRQVTERRKNRGKLEMTDDSSVHLTGAPERAMNPPNDTRNTFRTPFERVPIRFTLLKESPITSVHKEAYPLHQPITRV